jgi:hypothetical protein
VFHGVEHRTIKMGLPPFAGRYTAYDIGFVLNHLAGVKGAFFTGKSLYDDSGVFIN